MLTLAPDPRFHALQKSNQLTMIPQELRAHGSVADHYIYLIPYLRLVINLNYCDSNMHGLAILISSPSEQVCLVGTCCIKSTLRLLD